MANSLDRCVLFYPNQDILKSQNQPIKSPQN